VFFILKKFGKNFGVFLEYSSQLSFFLYLSSLSGIQETNSNNQLITKKEIRPKIEFCNEIILTHNQNTDSHK
jgi:hypothetical protein